MQSVYSTAPNNGNQMIGTSTGGHENKSTNGDYCILKIGLNTWRDLLSLKLQKENICLRWCEKLEKK